MDGELRQSFNDIDDKVTRLEYQVGELRNDLTARNNAWVRVLLTGAVAGAVIVVSRHIPAK